MSGPLPGAAAPGAVPTGAESPSAALLRDMAAKGIDAELTLSILGDYNAGLYDGFKPVKAVGVPRVDGVSVVSLLDRAALRYSLPTREARDRLGALGLGLPPSAEEGKGGRTVFGAPALEELGSALLGRTAYGVLNGGSATSYADSKKNLAFGQAVFEALEPSFRAIAPLCEGEPKGLTPAYLEPEGGPGASFLLLKMRARLMAAARSRRRGAGDTLGDSFMPLFQMTSRSTDERLAEAYAAYREGPFIAPLARELGLGGGDWATGVQPLIAAFTHSSEGRPKRIFDRARGQPDSAIALPGGHGQCFRVLAPVLRALRDSGLRFAYLGNVDNLGYVPDPVEIALLALSGRPAAFDFSLRTPMDVKGGILVETEGGEDPPRSTVADIGPAISFDEVRRLEAGGYSILFNCAIGLFDLDWLVPRLDEIGRLLPVRFTDQDKDAGKYSQAEQVTWEVAGILPSFLAFAVDKYDRFIAAKLLAETLLTSGVASGDPRVPLELAETSGRLKTALERKLRDAYGLEKSQGRWVPRLLG